MANNAYFGGGYVTVPLDNVGGVDLYALYNRVSGTANTELYTLGARLSGSSGKLTCRAEGSYQAGESGANDVSAFMVGGRLGFQLSDKTKLTLWGDLLSGDDDPTDGDTKVFNTLFATNHKFYGFADLFLNVPLHTNGQGLVDFAVKLSLKPQKDVTLGIDLHSFRLSKKRALSSARLGEEVDVTFAYKYSKQASIVLGGAYVKQQDALGAIDRLSDDMKWAYVTTNVAF